MAAVQTILENGWIYTGLEDGPRPGGLVLSGGEIVAVGTPEELAALVSEDPEPGAESDGGIRRIDLRGRLVVPGFQDAHMHPVFAGVELLQCDLTSVDGAEAAVDAVRRYAEDNPEEPWILGAGWSMEWFPGGTPTRGLLDAVVPDRPVFLQNRDHHGAWVNSKALELAGITAATPDPESGRFERGADGTPAGTVHEGAMDLFNEAKPDVPHELAYAGLLKAQDLMLSQGITAWQDAWVAVPQDGGADSLKVYLDAAAAGDLKVRVRICQWWDRTAGTAQLDGILERREEVARAAAPERLSAGSVKVMVDGVAENFTAAMHHPYRDHHGHHTDNRGIEFFDAEEMKGFVAALDAHGFQVHFHALGDRAVTDALDAVERARSVNGGDHASANRHHLAHLQLVRPEDTARFAALDATANLQALWACHEEQLDDLTLPFLEPDAEEHHYPFGELAAHGTRLAAGSDWPVSTADPLAALHVAVNRTTPGADGGPLGPERQKLGVKAMLDAYTQGTAYVNHLDHLTGTLEPGKLADFVILDRDVFAVQASEIHTVRVDETWIDGERVYQRDGAA
ncbi:MULTISPECIES: amidohydrolase [Arthrobacter]|uniref:Amidohydrolase family protein n=2 Tax=Arthrobacter TaxID=1663 RepID=A0ABU9KIN2_9MICC|nr:amidohydrolase [Arthrobacter sp. YJM1]MDP5226306.1 amidohydrolase family protein [Arthrobacter sp. YJM1]